MTGRLHMSRQQGAMHKMVGCHKGIPAIRNLDVGIHYSIIEALATHALFIEKNTAEREYCQRFCLKEYGQA